MVRLLGAGLILVSFTLFGMQQKQRLLEHMRQLVNLKELLLLLSGELSYARTPLSEALLHIAERGREPFCDLFSEVAAELGKRQRRLPEIWQEALFRHQSRIYFDQEEFRLLEGLGDNFGYLDIHMQLGQLSLVIQQLDGKITEAQGELEKRQRLYQYLCVMSGLFLILVLL